jgi:cellulose synthase operon protein C
VACGPAKPPSTPAVPVLDVEYKGCWAFDLPGRVCTLQPGPNHLLNLWIRTTPPNLKVEIRASGQLLTAARKEVEGGGWNCKPRIPLNAGSLTVSVVSPGGSHGPIWSLPLQEREQPWTNEILKQSQSPGSPERLERLLKSVPPKEQGFIFHLLAIQARNAGNLAKEEEWLLAGKSADLAENRWSGVVEKTVLLAGIYTDGGRFGDAEKILDALKPLSNPPAEDKYFLAYQRGLLAEATGDYRLALERLREADELAKRLDVDKYQTQTEEVLLRVFQDLGRSREAANLVGGLVKRLEREKSSSCDSGDVLTNAGWFWLMEQEAGKEALDPTPILKQAQATFEKCRCRPSERLNSHLNLALAYQQKKRWPDAQQELDHARSLRSHSDLAELFWWDDLEARAAINVGQPESALRLYQKLEKRSELAASPAGILRALLGQANARIALDQQRAAIDTLAQAERQIENQSRHIPVHQGLDTFFAYQEAVTRNYLDLLLKDQQWQRAFNLTRQSRSRLLRQLAVRDRLSHLNDDGRRKWLGLLSTYHALRSTVESDAAERWQLAVSEKKRALEAEVAMLGEAQEALDGALDVLPNAGEDKLSPPAPGEVILTYHPLRGPRWAGFAATVQGIEVATFNLPDPLPTNPADLSRLLLKPSASFQSAIAASKSVRVLPYGPLRSVDFHALPFDGDEPLLATHLVAYSLDLPVHASPPPLSGRPVALVVSNPTSDLQSAEAEGKTVAAAIRRWPARWTPEPLDGRDAQSGKVLRMLPGASFFHYAGHGTFGGFAGWNSELPLANKSRLTLSDILSLPRAPDWIVLSACDAAHTSEEAPGEGVGLANAFLLAGSRGVVAARQQVPDPSANALMYELYSKWRSGEDLQHQLRRAQLACRGNHSFCQGAWASFRFLIP